MRQTIERMLRGMPPSPDELWRRNNASFQTVEANGNAISVPVFDLPPAKYEETNSDRFTDSRGRDIGTVYDGVAVVGSTPHQTRVWRLDDDEVANPNLCIDDRAALGTEIDGYPTPRARKFAVDKRLHVRQIATEYSVPEFSAFSVSARRVKRLAEIALDARKMCISKTAMEEELIAHELDVQYFGGEIDRIRIGDSQPAMTAAASVVYAEHLFNQQTAAIDTKAACCYDPTPLPKAARWLGKEVVGGFFVLGQMVLDGDTEGIHKTLSRNPELWAGVIFGKIHALRNGEITENMAMLDRSQPGQVLRYADDTISSEQGMRQWDLFTNINQKDVQRAIHMHLLKRKGNQAQLDRVGRQGEMHAIYGNLRAMTQEDKAYVYGPNAQILQKMSGLALAS